jgi:sulfate/thiosulfate transport system substrate-binding protein
VILRHRLRALAAPLALIALVLSLAAGCGEDAASGSGGSTLTLVAYSTPREAYEEVIPAFRATPEGEGIDFEQSYGASGEQRRAVESGLPADVVAFSLEPDVTALVDKGLVDPGWNAGPTRGMVTESVVVFAVREGNPKGIRTWDDLVKPGVEVITPNPFTSGGAQWNVMAAYGAQIAQGKEPEQGLAYVDALFRNVPVQNKSAREALQTFSAGKGDVLIAYENEAITARQAGEGLEYVIPEQTLLIENPIAVTTKNPAAARRFVDFALTPEAQRIFGEKGYRPVDDEVLAEFDYAVPPTLLTIDEDLGGWKKVRAEFFDPEDGAVAEIFRGQGISTE